MRLYKRDHPARVLPFEIAPMIDVVFLLIIFFMVTAQFARLTRAEVNLPLEPGEQQRAAEQAGIVINIMRDGRIIVGEEMIELADLRAFVQHEMRQRGVAAREVKLLLRADRDADAAALNQVVAHLQQIGISAARIATEVPARMGAGP